MTMIQLESPNRTCSTDETRTDKVLLEVPFQVLKRVIVRRTM